MNNNNGGSRKKYRGVSKNNARIVQNLLDRIAFKLTFLSCLDGPEVICQVILHTCQQMPTTLNKHID